MPMRNEEVASSLNYLLRSVKDSEEGFRTASEDVDEPDLKQLFDEYAEQRRQFADELKKEARMLGVEPEEKPSVAGAIHRGWMNLRASVQRGDEKAILSEAERGEDRIRDAYEEELQKDLPPSLRAAVQREFDQIRESHDRIRELRDRPKEG